MEFDPLLAQKSSQKLKLMNDLTAHLIAIIIVIGFFSVALVTLLGAVDISNAAVTAFVGTVLGYTVGKFDPLLVHYYKWNYSKISNVEEIEDK